MYEYYAPQVRLGEWISEGWTMFTRQWKQWVQLAILFFIPFLLIIVAYISLIFMIDSQGRLDPAFINPAPILFLAVFVFWMLVFPFLIGGMYKAAFKQLRGERIEISDIFSAAGRAGSILGVSLLIGLMSAIGLLLCIIPAFLVMGLTCFAIPLVVERELGPLEAIQTSWDTTRPNLLMFTLFAFLVQLIAQCGSYLCYIGLLATMPLQFTMMAVAYRDCFGLEGAVSFRPRPRQYYSSPSCPVCGTALPPQALFCPGCGRPCNDVPPYQSR